MAHVFVQQVLDAEAQRIGQQHLRALLQGPGTVNGKLRAKNKGKHHANNKNDNGHHKIFGDGLFVIRGLQMNRVQEPKGYRPEDLIEPMSELTYVFFHQLFPRTQDFVHTDCHGGRSQRTQTQNHA